MFFYVNCFALDFGAMPCLTECEYLTWTHISFLKEAYNTCPKLKRLHLNTDSSSETRFRSPSSEGMDAEFV